MRLNCLVWLPCLMVILAGCQMTPTKVTETKHRDLEVVVAKSQKPIELNDFTVVFDVRSDFEFGLNHIQNSIRFGWENLSEDAQTGEVMRDLRKAALRLALQGVTPQTPVVIVGNGRGGQGEEGRLAWTLLYLGFRDVQVGSVETFRRVMTVESAPPARNVPLWKTQVQGDLQIDRKEFLRWARDPVERQKNHVFILDVRTKDEYFAKGQTDYRAINIDWKEFYTAKGRPDPEIRGKLLAYGVRPQDEIILVSNRGVRSGAATYALLALGFSRAQNFTAGWKGL